MDSIKVKVFTKSRAEVEKDCQKMAKLIQKNFTPDLVVFIAKSGFIFAKPIADYFKCPLAEIHAVRPGDNKKNDIKKFIPWVPLWLLKKVLSSKANYGYNEENSEREVSFEKGFDGVDKEKVHNILLVDDSSDTGWSELKAKEKLEEVFPESNVKTFCYCVIEYSKKRIQIDYEKYENTIVLTATSRYSKEHKKFLNDLKDWEESK